MQSAIQVAGLGKRYARYAHKRHFSTLKSALLGGSLFGDLAPETSFGALEDVSFDIPKGTTVAVIGPNGSGKSTLLKVLAGILEPTTGSVAVDGRVAALLELGAGFHPEISGRENIIINGIMLGLGRREIESRIPEIIRFAELEDFIDAPVKTYSSGMYVRLGFSVAVAVEPDVLLVDEVLAVGDESFSHKCLDRFADLKRRGRTILLVTHALELAESVADSILLLEDGRLSAAGAPREVIDRYRAHVAEREEAMLTGDEAPTRETESASSTAFEQADDDRPDTWRPRRWGNGEVAINSVRFEDSDGAERHLFQTGEPATLVLEVDATEPQTDFVFGIAVHSRDGRLAYGTNTDLEGFQARLLTGRSTVRVTFPELQLVEGSYSVDVAVHTRTGVAFDYRRACVTVQMRSNVKDQGIARLSHDWRFDGTIELEPSEPTDPARRR